MNASHPMFSKVRTIAGLAGGLAAAVLVAFPPAPHHTVFGTVRDEQGAPLRATGAEVLLEAEGRAIARAFIANGSEPGVNYTMSIPLDAAVTSDLYKPTALRPTVPFRMRVKIGNTIYLPIEMTGASSLLTRPGERSRVNLTLGVDSDGDGMTNLQEYLAGTYAFDPEHGFSLAIVSTLAGRPQLEFVSIRGRSYSVFSSTDMQTWVPAAFSVPGDSATVAARSFYRAPDTRLLRVRVGASGGEEETPRFFKLMVY